MTIFIVVNNTFML